FYLAKAGFAPLVLERREVVGGVAVTEEIQPGFRCPVLLHTTGPLLPQIVTDLQLARHGLQIIRRDIGIVALHPDGRALRIYDDPQRTASEFATLSKHDAERYAAFHQSFTQLGAALRPFLSITPPDMDRLAIDDYLNFGKFGLRFRGL